MIPAPVFILTLPRSFSSVVCTAIGRNPDLYGFPELNLFLAENIAGVCRYCEQSFAQGQMHNNRPPGLLRVLAQLHGGAQTAETVQEANRWLADHGDWTGAQVFDHFRAAVAPLRGTEKSPRYSTDPTFLRRLTAAYPDARYIHLTRHPVGTQRSMQEFFQRMQPWPSPGFADLPLQDYCARAWCEWHGNIMAFTRGLPSEQTFRVRGEDILAEPDTHLPLLANWLGIRSDAEAVEAMKHPEQSPYAGFGPDGARVSGNDAKFQADPRLRRPVAYLSPELPAAWSVDPALAARVRQLAEELGYGA